MKDQNELYTEETKVERPAIEQLKKLGYSHVHGSELTPDHPSKERERYNETVLVKRLSSAIKKINLWINDDNLQRIVRDTVVVTQSSLLEANEYIHDRIVKYISIEQDLGKGRKNQTVKLIDFDHPERNEFLVVNQFRIQGHKENIRPDLILFVNGLPLAVIEAKSPYKTNPIEEAIDQLRRYANLRNSKEQEGHERLFWYNQMMVATCRDRARLGTISSTLSHYLEWKDPYPKTLKELGKDPTQQEILIQSVFNKTAFLDIIRNFTVFDSDDKRKIKKVPRYQQYRAVVKALDRIKSGKTRKDQGGVVWHTQGSGKSLTMVFLAAALRRDPVLKDYKLLFITDRTDLQRQLKTTFKNTQDESIIEVASSKHFQELLRKDSSDLIIGMLQKFQDREQEIYPELNASPKIVVLVDEAHRGQYKGLAANLNIALPNAPKIAFTGTPLVKNDKTVGEFGSYIDKYTIEQAVIDGATVQIIYEGRESNTKVTGESLDKLFDKYFSEYTDAERKEIIRKYGKEIAVLEAPKRIEMICIDILEHYRTKIQPEGFKAQIVTPSRRAAVAYKDALDRLGGPESAVIISGKHNDDEKYKPYSDKKVHENLIGRFKKPMGEDSLSILIVKDMLLTGFDAPIEQVMYLDRKLTDHTLLQAVARVNRTRSGKDCGFIVDYYGLSDYLKEALILFSQSDIQGCLTPLKEEIPRLEVRHQKVLRHFKGLDLNKIDDCIESLRDSQKRAEFEVDFKNFLSSMNIVLPDKLAAPFMNDLRRLGKINHGAKNRYRDEQLNISEAGAKVRQLIDEHIYSTGVDPKIPPTLLFSQEFMKGVKDLKEPKARAAELEYAIRGHIRLNGEQDPEYYNGLSERLGAIITENHLNWDRLCQLLIEFRDEMETNRKVQAEELGLTVDQYAFYNALKSAIEEKDPKKAKSVPVLAEILEVTNRLVSMLEDVTSIVDFFSKDDEMKKAKKKIKRELMETSFCDEEDQKLIKTIIDRFMELAKVKFSN